MLIPCKICGNSTEHPTSEVSEDSAFFRLMQRKWVVCDGCDQKQREDNACRLREMALKKLEDDWLKLCPPLYRQTDPTHIQIDQGVLSGLLQWENQGDGMAIGLHGSTGRCKTRMMFLLMKQLHFAGERVFTISSQRLGNSFSRSFGGENPEADEARGIVREVNKCSILFLDDLGKERFTDRTESEFYNLIEYRTSHLMPTFWTANAVGAELKAMMSADRGSAIIRRIREFSTPIEL